MPMGANAWRLELAKKEAEERNKFGWRDIMDLLTTGFSAYQGIEGIKQGRAAQDLNERRQQFDEDQARLGPRVPDPVPMKLGPTQDELQKEMYEAIRDNGGSFDQSVFEHRPAGLPEDMPTPNSGMRGVDWGDMAQAYRQPEPRWKEEAEYYLSKGLDATGRSLDSGGANDNLANGYPVWDRGLADKVSWDGPLPVILPAGAYESMFDARSGYGQPDAMVPDPLGGPPMPATAGMSNTDYDWRMGEGMPDAHAQALDTVGRLNKWPTGSPEEHQAVNWLSRHLEPRLMAMHYSKGPESNAMWQFINACDMQDWAAADAIYGQMVNGDNIPDIAMGYADIYKELLMRADPKLLYLLR